ncbi:MAG: translocation/assembly module TamB domain-containing protein [Ferruginibacter sp.]
MALIFIFAWSAFPTVVNILLLLLLATGWWFVFKTLKVKAWFFISFFLFIGLLWGLLNTGFVQNLIISKVTSVLSKDLQTKVTLKRVDIHFFDKVALQGLMVEDRKKDTLLYAGEARVNLTDWFFVKEKIIFNNIGLDDAIINMNRTDSVWNYQFLIDYFAGPSTGKKNKKGPQIDFRELHLKNIRFNRIDKWVGQSMVASLQKMDLSVDSMNIDKKLIAIKDIYLEKPLFWQSDFDGNKPVVKDLKSVLSKIPVVSAFKWNNSGWVVRLGKLQIFDGSFQNDKSTDRTIYPDRFDGQHILFKNINGNFSNLLFLNDTLHTSISLSAKERSGLEIKKLESNLKFTPELMEFNNLDLQTNKSRLRNYYVMGYESFNKDMSSFINNVRLEANFVESTLSTDDLAIFAPSLSSMKRVFYIEGEAKGTVDNFTARNMKIRTGSSFLDGNLSMRGLPDIKSTYIDLKANTFQSNYAELSSIIPSLKTVKKPSLARLGNITYKGTFTGFTSDFVAFGNINTSLGNFQADLNMKLPGGKEKPSYSGKISTSGFQLGQFIPDNNFGIVALNGTIKGSGFSMDELNANFKGDIQKLYYGGYTYTNAMVDGTLKNKTFSGKLSINDPNVRIKTLDGEFSFADKEMAFNANANLDYINLKAFGISKENLELAGTFNLNFRGNNIDDFLGTARVYDASLRNNGHTLSFDSLILRSFIQDSIKNLQLETNELYANLNGRFKVKELPAAFTVFLSKYYPSYIKAPKINVSEQDFSFEIKTRKIDEYIRLFDNKLSGFDNASISGSILLSANELNIKAKVPEFTYDGKTFTGLSLAGIGNRDTLYTNITADNIKVSDSMQFPQTVISLAAHNDVSVIKLKTSANKTLNEAELNATVTSYADGVHIHFSPSTFVLNNKRWNLEKDGELTLRKNFPIDAQEIKFASGEQQIVIKTEMEEETSNINLVAQLQSVVMEDFLPLFLTKPDLRGKLTGKATVRDPFGKALVRFEGATDSLVMDGSYLGKVNLSASTNTETGMIDFKVKSDEKDFAIDAGGYYNYKDSTGNKMNIQFNSTRFRLNVLQPYLQTVFSKVDGFAKGNITLKDGQAAPLMLGAVTIDTGSITVAYTQCKYLLNNQTINFGQNSIDLGLLRLRDTLGNTGTASGRMDHNFFRNFNFHNLRVETDKMLLLNTTQKDNIQFYGTVIGNAVMTIDGPTSDMKMNIDGAPSSVDSSHIYLPTGATAREGSKIDYIDFIQFGSEMDKDVSNVESSNITVNLNITANPACKVDVILDEETGDVIKGQGNGKLNITVGTTEKLSIRGRYILTGGEYTFNFQTFVKKYFTLNQGSITWNGDPYLASIDIDAEYLAKNVDISNITLSNGVRRKADIKVLSHLTGYLNQPEIDFEFKFLEGSDGARDYFAVKKLDDFKNDKNNMFKQVASLLLLNSFISDQEAFLTGQSTFNIAASTVGGIMSSWLTNLFNKELERATKGILTTYIDINPTLDLQSRATELQANVRAGFKLFLSSRLVVLIAGNYEYNNPYAQLYGRNLLTPDISIEWLLNKDGSLRVVGFNRTTIDFTSNQRNMSGVQLAYRKEFDKISDIFKSRKAILQQDSIKYKLIPADSTYIKKPVDTTSTGNP